jgi:hypothetical protein
MNRQWFPGSCQQENHRDNCEFEMQDSAIVTVKKLCTNHAHLAGEDLEAINATITAECLLLSVVTETLRAEAVLLGEGESKEHLVIEQTRDKDGNLKITLPESDKKGSLQATIDAKLAAWEVAREEV